MNTLFLSTTDFIKWPVACILMLLVLYAAVRLSAAAWFKSKQDYISAQRKAFNTLISKSTKRKGDHSE